MSLFPVVNSKKIFKKIHLSIAQNICNQVCVFCYKDKIKNIPAYDYKKLLEIFDFIRNNEFAEVIIQGGEPTIVPEVFDFCKMIANETKSHLHILTNGKLFDEQWRKLMVRHGSMVNFSLNSANQKTYRKICLGGNLMTSIENIIRFNILKESQMGCKCKVSISMVVCLENICELADFYLLAKELKVDLVRYFLDITSPHRLNIADPQIAKLAQDSFYKLQETIKENPIVSCYDLKELAECFGVLPTHVFVNDMQQKEFTETKLSPEFVPKNYFGCTAPWDSIYIDHFYNVFSCCNSKYCLCNLYTDKIENILKSKKMTELKNFFINKNYVGCTTFCREKK
jgi:MoaA/NifB/PqqE/SkfB family radical SAM enzyme